MTLFGDTPWDPQANPIRIGWLPDFANAELNAAAVRVKDNLNEARKDPRWAKVPIVVLTARTLEMDAVRALETGASDFIRKPFLPDELIARIRRAIELGRPRSAS